MDYRLILITVMTQFRGRIYAWDVVNEAFNEDGTFRASPFYNSLGEGYIETAFRTARGIKEGSKLYINDYNIEGTHPFCSHNKQYS
jgi:endo-1,4-beta-xylanase